ncbi:MAG: hypothetical protein A2142_02835 [candidate division Zixibacteria bacterium RBG_16_48_11]|nr:MAG: hypothetical protein A2142_02835 [candidate division Zixibacteria bacterium RBG_16_48_11]
MTERTFFILLLFALLLLFIFQNTQTIAVRFLFWKISMSLALWLFFPLLAGVMAGALAFRTPRKKSDSAPK